jgi:4-diphosphocytidyl-2-C-methyl-D-erythritol kinase
VKKLTVKIPAKLNLTLDILGKANNNYHNVKSLVASINVYDTVTVIKRQDDVVTLKEQGFSSGCSIEKNNAYKSAKLFMDTFFTPGNWLAVNRIACTA